MSKQCLAEVVFIDLGPLIFSFIHTWPYFVNEGFALIFYTFSFSSNTATYQVAGKCSWNVWICNWWNAFWFWGMSCGRRTAVKLQIFVRNPFSYFWLETGPYELIFVLSRPQNKITLKFDGLKTKVNFHPVLNVALFSKVRKYEIKYRTEICDFTVSLYTSTTMEKKKNYHKSESYDIEESSCLIQRRTASACDCCDFTHRCINVKSGSRFFVKTWIWVFDGSFFQG